MDENITYYTDLINKYFAGEANSEDLLQVSVWLKSNEDNQKLFSEYQKTWEAIEKSKIDSSIDIDSEWDSLSKKLDFSEEKEVKVIPLKAKNKIPYLFLKIAAGITLIIGITFAIYHSFSRPSKQFFVADQLAVERKLPDGTVVSLNAGSTLEYPEEFEDNYRPVQLKGEAYFDVAHDPEKPFIISVEDLRIEVLGTKFYVNADTNGNVEVILNSGKVAVYYKDKDSKKIIMNPGDKVEVSKKDKIFEKVQNEKENYISWKTKKLVFVDDPMFEVVDVLNKYYHSRIYIANEKIAKCRLTATFENQSLESVLNVLKATLNVKVIDQGSSIEISGQGCK
ncbi:MAG: FecR domain-containing protein [Bacteroidetes bacterium]|nr:FecR domain-containing protein [Bacteroidota bacterium]